MPQLKGSLLEGRGLKSRIFTGITWVLAILASLPLFSVIFMLIAKGGARINWETLTSLPPAAFEFGGGIGPAIVGTAVMVLIASAISIPIGILAAIYLAEIDPYSRLAQTARFLAKVLTGFPSILAGVFVYAAMVVAMKTYSAWAGGVALAVLMLPTIILTAEEALKQVPQKMKDAAYGMGCTRAQVISKVTLPTGIPGVVTGVLLAVAGAAGESAPLLFTALFSTYFINGFEGLSEPTSSLSILIYNFSGMPYDNQIELAWTASLVLVLIILVFNILARVLGRQKH
ncbi:phosphate ABC transporter, permease protein PstA [Halochromatium glycolicum]|uniref:Phosphate transport system permease protein PstA n=2 Tax=Halochromatium glycolicum TaxID=85075 RepID=A0AAJ0U7Z7_9GAMM|nr:phosphate ABC transporter, permease protein PstA [Halochromatium glycolicum]